MANDNDLDARLLQAIEHYDGVPNSKALSKLPNFPSKTTIKARIDASSALQTAMQTRGTNYIKTLPEEQLLAYISTSGQMGGLPDYAQQLIDERFDEILLREIQNFNGVPSINALSKLPNLPGFGPIQRRIHANPGLWKAYHQKRGLTPDQAVELSLERNEDSPASIATLKERLRNLHAYREMIGIIRCFSDLLKGNIVELSLYPEPLAKAAKELGSQLNATHIPLQPFKQGKTAELPKADVVVLQGLHRVATERVTDLFAKVHESLGQGQILIVTHSVEYAPVDDFTTALHQNGFDLQDSGTMSIGIPNDEVLLSHGVASVDLDRIKRKLSGDSKILTFETIRAQNQGRIPSLQSIATEEGKRILLADAEGVDTPKGIGRVLAADFFEDSVVLASDKFIVTVFDGNQPIALIGYDMHPQKRNAIETHVLPGAPDENYRQFARKLAKNASTRRKLGVKAGKDNKIQLATLKR